MLMVDRYGGFTPTKLEATRDGNDVRIRFHGTMMEAPVAIIGEVREIQALLSSMRDVVATLKSRASDEVRYIEL